jgi:hypothetical protein
VKAWLLYTIARLGIFAAVLVILLVVGIKWYIATIVAALVGLMISYIALPKLRYRVATTIAERRAMPEHDDDSDFEDDFVDADDSPAPGAVSDADRHAALRHDADQA